MKPPADRPFLLGLTGSIGMGKTTTAQMFRDAGIPVWDADAAVHRLYGPGGAAVAPVAALCPEAATAGGIDRAALKRWIAADDSALARLEAVVHPLVARDRTAFIDARASAPLIVLDIPLLFETGADRFCDATLVVSAPPEAQRARVLARPGMTEAQFRTILARQMPDAEKRARATHVIETRDLESTRAAVQALVAQIIPTEPGHA
ncbi:MAG: dephospho-CoA kinase [Rhodobacteraceae bacterium]|nr:dephospho-CoA kinase [Paracoccaceae bacterium]